MCKFFCPVMWERIRLAELTKSDEHQMASTDPKDKSGGAVPPDVAQQIDANLKRLYSETASEELPDTLTELLAALRKQESSSGSDKA